jgi:rhodanese-related sulfurtransferase/glyoxylase-like metal-dependent hydrolase (beta-lactamase superfamily II)
MYSYRVIILLLTVFIHFTIAPVLIPPAHAAGIKDSESASHDTDAASYNIVNTYSFSNFRIIQLTLPVLSTYSYLLISGSEALAIDPGRDIAMILETAKKESVTIRGVYLTHSHADFIAGHMEMANMLKCPIYQSKKSGAQYSIQPLSDGDRIPLGAASLKFIDTPGHTPDGMCALVFGKNSPDVPEAMFTGDVLFVGSMGRPDLLEGSISAAWLASAAFDSWFNKISRLGDGVTFFPAHGAGSLCGAHLSEEPFSTIGKEKASNPYVKYTRRSDFIAALLEGLPDAPQYFRHNARINREGPPLIDWNTPPPADIPAAASLSDPDNAWIVDVRSAPAYSAGHIPNAVNIALRGRLEIWTGIMIPWGAKLVLCGSAPELKESLFRLHRIGYSAAVISLDSWKKAGLAVNVTPSIPPGELYNLMQKGLAPVIVDVRLPAEWMGLRIGTVLNLPLNQLSALSSRLDPSEPVVAVCNSAFRSSLAVGVLERNGFKKARSLEGGSQAWIQAGLPVHEAAIPGAAGFSGKLIRLPESIPVSALQAMMTGPPGAFDLVDIRTTEAFSDYHIPGSRNIDIPDVISNPVYLAGAVPLILVDRDGSLAMAVGGILSQKTERPIRVLSGGLEAFWSQTERKTGRLLPDVSRPAFQPLNLQPATDIPEAPASPAPPAKRKSAGC